MRRPVQINRWDTDNPQRRGAAEEYESGQRQPLQTVTTGPAGGVGTKDRPAIIDSFTFLDTKQ